MNLRVKDKIFLGIAAVGLLLLVVTKLLPSKQNDSEVETALLRVGNTSVTVVVADSDERRYRGLSNVEQMEENKGMLFVYDEAVRHPFVMRDMKFDLDFVFIRDGKVVDMAKNVAREYKGEVRGATEYDTILEVNTGWIQQHEVEIGDGVELKD